MAAQPDSAENIDFEQTFPGLVGDIEEIDRLVEFPIAHEDLHFRHFPHGYFTAFRRAAIGREPNCVGVRNYALQLANAAFYGLRGAPVDDHGRPFARQGRGDRDVVTSAICPESSRFIG
jgi:hypothetical protein